MRNKRRLNKQNKIIMVSAICLTLFLSVGYAAFNTNLMITAKGNLKQKPFAIEKLKEKVVTSGDGLYEDSIEQGRYIYKGSNPDNYIWLDENNDKTQSSTELYRILSVESDNVVKVLRKTSTSQIKYDLGYNDYLAGVTEKNSIIGTRYSSDSSYYCYKSDQTAYRGCNVWGSIVSTKDEYGNTVTSMVKQANSTDEYVLPETDAYANTYLNTIFYNQLDTSLQSNIISHSFNQGVITGGNNLTSNITQEKKYTWIGKIGLLSVTKYVRITTNHTECGSITLYNTNYSSCKDLNWVFNSNSGSLRLLTPIYNGQYYIYSDGHIYSDTPNDYQNVGKNFYPSFYLSSDIKLKGYGTINHPYYIVNE